MSGVASFYLVCVRGSIFQIFANDAARIRIGGVRISGLIDGLEPALEANTGQVWKGYAWRTSFGASGRSTTKAWIEKKNVLFFLVLLSKFYPLPPSWSIACMTRSLDMTSIAWAPYFYTGPVKSTPELMILLSEVQS